MKILQSGEIVILQTGRYYVYSQVYFISHQVLTHLQSVSHYIHRGTFYNSEEKQTLLHGSETKSISNEARLEHTSFLAGTFYLRQGDRISVTVSDIFLVHSHPESTHFGILKV